MIEDNFTQIGKDLRLFRNFFLLVGLLFVGFIVFTMLFPGYERTSARDAERIRSEADIVAIRQWMAGLKVEVADYGNVPRDEWPKAVRRLAPHYVEVKGSPTTLRLDWGGGLSNAHGAIIGPVESATPASSSKVYCIPIEPGIYAFHDL